VMVVCISARPPYGALLLLLFYPGLRVSASGGYRPLTRIWLAAAIAIPCLIAMAFFQSPAWTPAAPPRSVPGQLAFLLHQPAAIFRIAVETLRANAVFYAVSFVGVLGWLDAPLAHSFYFAAGAVFIVVLIVTMLDDAPSANETNGERSLLLLPFLLCFGLTCAALYLTWTPVGQWVVEGVQGRYLTAAVPLLALALPQLRLARRSAALARVRHGLTLLVMALPLFAYQQIVTTIVDRFYLQ
jgi:uncharacterized membrane protein